MSLPGYKPKHKPALWLQLPSERLARQWTAEAKPPKRKYIRPRAKRHAKTDAEYTREARAFVQAEIDSGKSCPVVAVIEDLRNGRKYGHPISDKLKANHHIFGRQGRLKNWKPGWMAVSTQGHRWIHSNIKEAQKHRWYAPPGLWNNEKLADLTADQLKEFIRTYGT